MDVIKTRINTGALRPGSPLIASLKLIYQVEGVQGLYAGILPRVLWSALYGGIGLSCYERCKQLLIDSETSKAERVAPSANIKMITTHAHAHVRKSKTT